MRDVSHPAAHARYERRTVVFTIFPTSLPPASTIAFIFFSACRVCASTPPSTCASDDAVCLSTYERAEDGVADAPSFPSRGRARESQSRRGGRRRVRPACMDQRQRVRLCRPCG